MDRTVFIASDLDRTLIPNGDQPESPLARPLLRAFAARPEVTLTYVSGRSKKLQQEAIEEWLLPVPTIAIADVGTTVYEVGPRGWRTVRRWARQISESWNGGDHRSVLAELADLDELVPQPDEQQAELKASFFVTATERPRELLDEAGGRLADAGLESNLVWSVDEAAATGLLDVIPATASKQHAVRFVIDLLGVSEDRALFAGDSGNDLDALTSGLKAVLVANAREVVRHEAVETLRAGGGGSSLYLARGGFMGMNGCYAAGVLEGVAHHFPDVVRPLREMSLDLR